jgi:hypothetical protein
MVKRTPPSLIQNAGSICCYLCARVPWPRVLQTFRLGSGLVAIDVQDGQVPHGEHDQPPRLQSREQAHSAQLIGTTI